MSIEKVMSKDLVIAKIDDSIADVAMMMQKWDIGFLPVSDNKKIVGVITDRDIVINAISNNENPKKKIENYITKNVINIDVDESLEDAVELMGDNKVKRLIVTNNKKVVGVLSLSDIINSKIDDDLIMDNIKEIWNIYRNIDEYQTEIDEFYL